jgi:lysophospholipase L1-like esterase
MPHGNELSGSAVRQIVRATVGGSKISLHLSNEHSTEPLEIKSVYVANVGEEHFDIDPFTVRAITFNGCDSVTIPSGMEIASDVVEFDLAPLQRLSITINYGHVPAMPTIHSGSRTHSYILPTVADALTDFSGARSEQHWYSISGLDVITDEPTECIACLGNSITDGRGVTIDADNRWTDILANQLEGRVAVLNLGIGGNCVLRGGLGPTARERFNSDILAKSGVTKVIVFEGINDIGSTAATAETGSRLIRAYQRFIKKAHDAGIEIYGATITPMKGSGYYSDEHEKIRQEVNDWILHSGEFDGVLDLSSVVANPDDSSELNPQYQFDAIHPNPDGYRAIGLYIADYFNRKSKNK